MTQTDAPPPNLDLKYRFLERHKTMAARTEVEQLANDIRQQLATDKPEPLHTLLHAEYPADIADAMFFLNDTEDQTVFERLEAAEAAEVLDELDGETKTRLVASASPERLASILSELMPDEATDILDACGSERRERVLALLPAAHAEAIRTLLTYPKESAGGIMTSGFVAVPETATQAETVQAFAQATNAEH